LVFTLLPAARLIKGFARVTQSTRLDSSTHHGCLNLDKPRRHDHVSTRDKLTEKLEITAAISAQDAEADSR
jgi:formylmethanofuran dehydrogenase subunit A